MEDARLYMQGQERTARTSGQRQWLARGVSPERAFEMRAARANSWAEFTQEEVDAMTPSMRHAMTTRLATQAAAAAKAKARAEAEEIAREVSRRKKAEHDAKVAEAAMENIKKEAAKKKLEVLAAIEEEANAEILRYERQLQAAMEESLKASWAEAQPATSDAASSRDTPAASSNQVDPGRSCPSLLLSPNRGDETLRHSPLPPARGARARAALTSRARRLSRYRGGTFSGPPTTTCDRYGEPAKMMASPSR